jgi:hypothetical protein
MEAIKKYLSFLMKARENQFIASYRYSTQDNNILVHKRVQ